MQNRTVGTDTCISQLFSQPLPWLTVLTHFTFFHRQVSAGHIRSLRPVLPSRRIPPDDCSGPVIPWPRASAVYISLMDSHSNLPEQTHPSCTAEPLENPSLRQFQACLSSQIHFSGMFPSFNLCYLSQNKIRTKLMSALNLYASLLSWGTSSFIAGDLSGDE